MKKRRSYRPHFFIIICPLIFILLDKIGLSGLEAMGVFVILLIIIQVFLEKVFGTNLITPIRNGKFSDEGYVDHSDIGDNGNEGCCGDD